MNKISISTRIIIFLLGIAVLAGIASLVVHVAIYISIACLLAVLGIIGYKLFALLFLKK